MRPKLTYANVMATIAVFIALGGASYAAIKLPKNSVGTKQIKKNAVRTPKIKDGAVTARKVKKGTLTGEQIDASTLGTVPSAQTAQTATTLAAPENWHEVGAPGEPGFMGSYKNQAGLATAAFFKDHEGIVHLKGNVSSGTSETVFQLPPGYRPATALTFPVLCSPCGTGGLGQLTITSLGNVESPSNATSLNGVTFRAGS